MNEEPPPAQTNGTNGTSTLAKLLNQLNVPTLAAIMLMGGGNFFAVKEDGRLTRDEARHVIAQVQDMHESMTQFERRQKEALARATDLLENQSQILKNQSMMISNQQQLISQLNKPPP